MKPIQQQTSLLLQRQLFRFRLEITLSIRSKVDKTNKLTIFTMVSTIKTTMTKMLTKCNRHNTIQNKRPGGMVPFVDDVTANVFLYSRVTLLTLSLFTRPRQFGVQLNLIRENSHHSRRQTKEQQRRNERIDASNPKKSTV